MVSSKLRCAGWAGVRWCEATRVSGRPQGARATGARAPLLKDLRGLDLRPGRRPSVAVAGRGQALRQQAVHAAAKQRAALAHPIGKPIGTLSCSCAHACGSMGSSSPRASAVAGWSGDGTVTRRLGPTAYASGSPRITLRTKALPASA
eukprot:scaffold22148_cov101-Isochrysis_galbana.AAC.3